MANSNTGMNRAGNAKKDEFYTQLVDIERELSHYETQFHDKIIFCNCDDPEYSNFWLYFQYNFFRLNLKKLISTHYEAGKTSYKMEIVRSEIEKPNLKKGQSKGQIGYIPDYVKTPLKGDGDFRSQECIDILQEADIVITNPPFSLFKEYIAQLIFYDKKFLIIGNQNAITYKEVFPHIKDNKVWLGYGFPRNCAHFINKYYQDTATDTDHREGMIRVSGIMWFTNLDVSLRHERMLLYRTYDPALYPHYDNYDAIEVGKTVDIPCDYDGVMGVPITFMPKYNPEQFEIVGATESEGKGFSNGLWRSESNVAQPLVNGSRLYKRIFIRLRKDESNEN